jgi:hypothetical protein
MLEPQYILLIMNCRKYAKKALYQKQTWLPKIPDYIPYYHVIGDLTLQTEFKFDEESRILWVKQPDDYVSLPKKVIAAYSAISQTFDFDYIFKTDDDQILVKPHFFNILSALIQKKTPKPHYGGYVVNVEKPYLSQYHRIHDELPKYIPILPTKYCSGRFYFISKEAVDSLITRKKTLIEKECLEDYAIGFNLADKYKRGIMNIMTNDFFTDIELSDFPKIN